MQLSTDKQQLNKARELAAQNEVAECFSWPEPPILIYQMGKVGSTSILKMLQNADQTKRCLQLHMLSERLERSKQLHQKKGNPYPYHLFASENVRKMLNANPNRLIYVIALVRDPVARQVSNIFQNPTPELMDKSGELRAELIIDYLNKKLNSIGYYQAQFNWFDAEFNRVLGIDIYKSEFNERGFQIYNVNRYKALIIRLESLKEIGAEAIESLLGQKLALKDVQANVRKQISSGDLYDEVRKGVSLNEEVLEKIYRSKFVRYFYTDEMIRGFVKRWADN